MLISDLRPDRAQKKLFLTVHLSPIDLGDVVQHALREAFRADLPVPRDMLPAQPCYFAWLGDDWQSASCGKLGETREEALWSLYDLLATELDDAGSPSRAHLPSQADPDRWSGRGKRLEEALIEAEDETLRKFARRVRSGSWQLVLDVWDLRDGSCSEWAPPRAVEPAAAIEEAPLEPLAGETRRPRPEESSMFLPRVHTPKSSSRRLSMAGSAASDADLEILVDRRDRRTAVVWVDGVVDDGTVGQLEDVLCDLLESGVLRLVLEVRLVQALGSSGLGLLVTCGDVLQEHGGRLILVGASQRLQRVLGVLEDNVFFDSVPELEAALEG